jgi:hypothetical protein
MIRHRENLSGQFFFIKFSKTAKMQLSKNPCRELNLGGVQLIKLVLAVTITVALPLSFLSLTEAGAADVETKADGKDNKSESKSENDSQAEDQGRPLEMRVKLAKRPYNFIQLGYMSVPEGGEDEYLAVEAEWMKIHEARCRRGNLLFWGLLKVGNPKGMGCQYVTIQGFNSFDDSRRPLRWWAIRRELGGELDEKALMQRTMAARKMLYTETYEIVDFEGAATPEIDVARFGYFQPIEGREEEYVDAEKELAAPYFRRVMEINPALKMWGLTRLVNTTASARSHQYRIFHLLDSTKMPSTDEEKAQLDQKTQALQDDSSDNTKWNELRKGVSGGQLKWVMKTSAEINPVNAEWEKLKGAWKCVRSDGSYRIKRIEPYQETLEVYDASGELKNTNVIPMRIEIKDGVNHFYTFYPQGTYHSVYKVHDGQWYEQGRGIFRATSKNAPDNFLIYDRIED